MAFAIAFGFAMAFGFAIAFDNRLACDPRLPKASEGHEAGRSKPTTLLFYGRYRDGRGHMWRLMQNAASCIDLEENCSIMR